MTREETVNLILLIHWWGEFQDVNADTPLDVLDTETTKKWLEEMILKEDDIFISHHKSPSWLVSVPDVVKDFFCINLMCVDTGLISQSRELLLPAFSLYPDKDYCIVTQPHTSPITPFLSQFSIVPPKSTNTFNHVLLVIHRALVVNTLPSVRPYMSITENGVWADTDAVKNLLSGLDQPDSLMEKVQWLETTSCYVIEFDGQIIGFAGFSDVDEDAV